MTKKPHLLLVGNPGPAHVGCHLWNASQSLEVTSTFTDIQRAFAAPKLWRALCWRLFGHRPARLSRFSQELLAQCRERRPNWVLTTGLAPVNKATLRELRRLGIRLLNFLTDDPWNRQHRAPWFVDGLPLYDDVFTPRRANIVELEELNGPKVHYLPFAYAPEIHFPPPPLTSGEHPEWRSEVLFIGGADAERAVTMKALASAGVPLSLWGGYWERDAELARCAHGHAGPEAFRHLVAGASVNLGLVRRANRDGHSMRTFELAAIGGCMLVENTREHRDLFGANLEAVAYFDDDASMLRQVRFLLDHPEQGARLRQAVRDLITQKGHTYRDRLQQMLAIAGGI